MEVCLEGVPVTGEAGSKGEFEGRMRSEFRECKSVADDGKRWQVVRDGWRGELAQLELLINLLQYLFPTPSDYLPSGGCQLLSVAVCRRLDVGLTHARG